MPTELDPRIADNLVLNAVSSLWTLPSEKIVCTRRALKEALHAVVQEAYAIGFLAGQEMRFRESTRPRERRKPTPVHPVTPGGAVVRRLTRISVMTLRTSLRMEWR
jgi:hypothetical protein